MNSGLQGSLVRNPEWIRWLEVADLSANPEISPPEILKANYALKCDDCVDPHGNCRGIIVIERINSSHGNLLAIIIRSGESDRGVHFITDDDSVHQLGILQWPTQHIIEAHIHNPLERTIDSTQEVLFIRSGRVRVDLYTEEQRYECSRTLDAGDVVFLVSGGHGFEILEEANIIEVKQGPYAGEREKTRFAPQGNPHLS